MNLVKNWQASEDRAKHLKCKFSFEVVPFTCFWVSDNCGSSSHLRKIVSYELEVYENYWDWKNFSRWFGPWKYPGVQERNLAKPWTNHELAKFNSRSGNVSGTMDRRISRIWSGRPRLPKLPRECSDVEWNEVTYRELWGNSRAIEATRDSISLIQTLSSI